MAEEWLPIDGYSGLYEVSDLGRVRSLDTRVKTYQGTRARKGRILRLKLQNGGYQIVLLSKDSVVSTFTVHRLVANAFLPVKWGRPNINHRDFNKTNNAATNLEWCSQLENASHTQRAGRTRNGSTKLTHQDVRDIRSRLDAGEPAGFVSDRYKISILQVRRIGTRERWGHIRD